MPPPKAGKSRSGDNARGAARINMVGELPNTASAEWHDKFLGKASTSEVLGDAGEDEENDTPQKRSVRDVAKSMKRPMGSGAGAGHGQGKTPRTIARRLNSLHAVVEAELEKRQTFLALENTCKATMANIEGIIKPQAEALGFDSVYLYIKYQAVRIYRLQHVQRCGEDQERALCLASPPCARAVRVEPRTCRVGG